MYVMDARYLVPDGGCVAPDRDSGDIDLESSSSGNFRGASRTRSGTHLAYAVDDGSL